MTDKDFSAVHDPAALTAFGDRLSLARKRRGMTADQMAKLAGISVPTLRSVERGGSGVGIGAYLAVLIVLKLDNDLDAVARFDEVGHRFQDMRLKRRKF